MKNLLDYALRLFDRGMICLPLSPGGKHLDLAVMGYDPLHKRARRKNLKELAFTGITFHLSQKPPSRETVAGWFTGFSGNVGILGGYKNLLILDFDDEPGFERWSKGHDALIRSTPVAKSPSGFHVYLTSAGPIISSSLHCGLRRAGHAKALGGYIVASPSMLASGTEYQWLPGQSPFDLDPARADNLAAVSLLPASPFKLAYDRLLGRGSFDDEHR